VLVTATCGSWHTSRLITTNADARGHVDLVVPYSSVITASLAGDLQHEDAAPKNTSVRVPSAFTASLARGVRVSNGVVHYAKLADMRQRVLLAPGRASRMVRVTLLYRIGARWFTTKPFTTYTSASGYVSTAMKQARRSVLYRIRYSFAGDTWNGGATTTTRAFILG
jgi:hypothetical protein